MESDTWNIKRSTYMALALCQSIPLQLFNTNCIWHTSTQETRLYSMNKIRKKIFASNWPRTAIIVLISTVWVTYHLLILRNNLGSGRSMQCIMGNSFRGTCIQCIHDFPLSASFLANRLWNWQRDTLFVPDLLQFLDT